MTVLPGLAAQLGYAGLAVLTLLASICARWLMRRGRVPVLATTDEELLIGLLLDPKRLSDGSGTASYHLTLLPSRPLRAAVVSVGTLDAPFAQQHLVGQLAPHLPVRLQGILPLQRQDYWVRVAVDCAGQSRAYRFARQLPHPGEAPPDFAPTPPENP